jgi:hypothetical protein
MPEREVNSPVNTRNTTSKLRSNLPLSPGADKRDCWLCDDCALAGPGTRFAFPLNPQTLAFSGRSCIVF